ncbi:hypothetical protein P152DRAFT_514959 [Eremomyces bilateralis CBS 781.70]|uniref:Uncharacterized protein n=1 Tax=Eremomyces bilateralis CBS 781.70 TaxID=1392243 RepID=A0A6G1G1A5_9PEZI|nr:uncharacterized protein P152DRAFT_514959 [Eremomyces bilateralis CBS 781.70]KAF1811834.1 hypothetical protein P152DRAFT_514959 [Eremomyces bilateralis CBS 781.70]
MAEVVILAEILSHLPGPDISRSSTEWAVYKQMTVDQIRSLPATLRSRRKSKTLCSLHQGLQSSLLEDVLHVLFEQARATRPSNLPHSEAADVSDAFQQGLTSLFDELFTISRSWAIREPTGPQEVCAGCILSQIQTNRRTLISIRAGMLGRMRSEKLVKSRRLQFLNTWIDAYPHAEAAEIFRISDSIGDHLKNHLRAVRVQNKKEKRKQRKRKHRKHDGSLSSLKNLDEWFGSEFERRTTQRKGSESSEGLYVPLLCSASALDSAKEQDEESKWRRSSIYSTPSGY